MAFLAFQYAINSALKDPEPSTNVSMACRSWCLERKSSPEMQRVNTRWHLDPMDGAAAQPGDISYTMGAVYL